MSFTWKNETRKTSDLVPADYNPRKLTEKQRAGLTRSLEKFGFVEPIIINKDRTIISGHQRIKVCADLGIETVDVRVPSKQLTKGAKGEEGELNIILNKIRGDFDALLLKENFDTEDLLLWGFEQEEIQAITGEFNFKNKEIEEEDLKESEHDEKKCPQCGYSF